MLERFKQPSGGPGDVVVLIVGLIIASGFCSPWPWGWRILAAIAGAM